jgi:hypothetical protein
MLVLAPIFARCADGPPVDVLLLRIETPWTYAPPEFESRIRTAPATVLLFRANGEYAEHHFWVIEQPDKTLLMSLGDPHVVAVGTWRRGGRGAIAMRRIVDNSVPLICPDPICDKPNLGFVAQSGFVADAPGSPTVDQYRPNRALKLPEFETYISQAKRIGRRCDGR